MRKKILSSVITLLVICIVSFANVQAYTTGDDYPAKYKNATKDSLVDPWSFYNRECTSFVAWCLNSRNEVAFTNSYMGTRFGDASNWGSAASGVGITVNNTPAVGAVAWWSSGHVAWVESVSGSTVIIEEYNYDWNGNYNRRSISSSAPTGYIHIKDIADDTTAPTISNVRVTDKTKDGYTVRCHVEDNVGVDRVMFPTWYDGKTGSDANWLTGTNDGSGEFSCRINVSDFGLTEGTYTTHIYAYDTSNNYTTAGVNTYIDATAPTLSDVKVYRTTTGYTVKCKVSDNYGIDRVQFPTWTEENGQDDILSDWYSNSTASGSIDGDNVSFEVKISDHNNETGKYITHIYAFDTCDNRAIYCFDVDVTFNDEKPTIEDVKITDIDETGYTVSCKVSAANGINRVQFPTWTAKDDQDDIQSDWYYSSVASGTIADDGTVTYRVNISDHNNESGLYNTHIYAFDETGNYKVATKALLVNSDGYTKLAEGTYNGSRYVLFPNDDNINFDNMNRYCQIVGGHLATITSQSENDFVVNLISESGQNYFYIGGTDRDTEGTWKWMNGEEWSYTNWNSGEPNNSGSEENYAALYNTGLWNDVTGTRKFGFVCEFENAPVFEITNSGTSADITNNGEERTATVIVADCDSGGVLTDVTASDITFAAGEKRTFMLGSGTHKVFVWDSLDGMKPLAEVE